MTTNELRNKYLDFFESKGHKVIPSASLVPENDPSTLFITAGMQPLVPYLLGEKHPQGDKLVNYQKCVRTGDIDEVGDNVHLSFFEMLGNWSLGAYFKEESIAMSFEFLTAKEWLGIDLNKLAVSVFEGDDTTSFDQVSYDKWIELGISESRIAKLGKGDNWWPAGGKSVGPQGPDTEIFFWTGSDPASDKFDPEDEAWVEIWNNVFMEFEADDQGKLSALKNRNVDTGMGLERTVVALNDLNDVYEIDTLKPIVDKVLGLSKQESKLSIRVIADHIRTTVMILGDDKGIGPSNVDQGYVVRKLLRRAIRHGKTLGIEDNFCTAVAQVVVDIFKETYPEIGKNQDFILSEIAKEETKFRSTLSQGLKEMQKFGSDISAKDAFYLYQSFGFPLELINEELASGNDTRKGVRLIDPEEFDVELKKHQELSRSGAEQKFKGGLIDQSEKTTQHHTAAHLMLEALRRVLGDHVQQKGSNITEKRIRFDFSHSEKLTDEQKEEVEKLVNDAIVADYPVSFEEMTVEEAKKQGATGVFEDRYGDKVKMYSIGDFSKEICGGPHVVRTGGLGHFRITKQESSSAGVRRIKAVLE
ncbi:MAG: alanine--tRNA ligase [Candidatus Uhrbacteria bacterium]